MLIVSCLPLFGQDWQQLGNDIEGDRTSWSGYSVALSPNGSRLAVGTPHARVSGQYNHFGKVKIYEWHDSTWQQLGDDINGYEEDNLGFSLSFSFDGNRLAMSAPYRYRSRIPGVNSQVMVFEWNGQSWQQVGESLNGKAGSDLFGYSVSLSSDGNRLAIGAALGDENGTNSGYAGIYEWNGVNWKQLGNDMIGEATFDHFGYSVSLSDAGNCIVVGAIRNSENSDRAGHVRIYKWNGDTWQQKGNDIDGEGRMDYMGWSVSLSSDGSRVAVGTPRRDCNGEDAGQVQIYEWHGSEWSRLGADIEGDSAGDRLGTSVSLSQDGNRVAVGVPFYDNNDTEDVGQVRIYEWNGVKWNQVETYFEGNTTFDQLGHSVSLSSDGNCVAAGATVLYNYPVGKPHARVYADLSATISIDLGIDTTVCLGYPLGVYQYFKKYEWSNGATSQFIFPQNSGQYSLTVTDYRGVTAADSIYLEVLSVPTINLGNDTVVCKGTKLTIGNYLEGVNYLWQDGSTEVFFSVQETGYYWVEVQNKAGCSSRDSIYVRVADEPEVYLGRDTTIFLNAKLTLNADSKHSNILIWDNGSASQTRQINPYELEEGENKIFVKAINRYGCTTSDTIIVTAIKQHFTLKSICQGDSLLLGGLYRSKSGTYIDTLASSIGYDSIVVTELTVHIAYTSKIDVAICPGDSYFYMGEKYERPGIYTKTLTAQQGCDSVVVINLGWIPIYHTPLSISICSGDSIYLAGHFRYHSGTYIDTLISSLGCDSIIATSVSYKETDYSLTFANDSLFAAADNATYQWIDCTTNQELIGETKPFLTHKSGSYAVQISNEGCVIVSDCYEVIITGFSDHPTQLPLKAIPNPTSGRTSIAFGEKLHSGYLHIYNTSGVLVHEASIQSVSFVQIDFSTFPSGLYTVVMYSVQGMVIEKVIRIN